MNNTFATTTAFSLLALGLLASPVLRAQAMQQGSHSIIINETNKVLENVAELKEQTEAFQSEFDIAKSREARWLALAQSPDTPEQERREAQARGLEERTNLVLTVREQMVRSLATYQDIATGLDKIIGAADEGAEADDRAGEARKQLTATLEQGFARDEEIHALVGQELANRNIPETVTRSFRDSRRRMLASMEAMKRLHGSFDKEAFGRRMHTLRDNVHSRLVHYETVLLITDHQLGNISTVAMVNQLTLMGDEIMAELSEILTMDDPLGLGALMPGSEFDYMAAPAGETPVATPGGQPAGGSLSAADFARPNNL